MQSFEHSLLWFDYALQWLHTRVHVFNQNNVWLTYSKSMSHQRVVWAADCYSLYASEEYLITCVQWAYTKSMTHRSVVWVAGFYSLWDCEEYLITCVQWAFTESMTHRSLVWAAGCYSLWASEEYLNLSKHRCGACQRVIDGSKNKHMCWPRLSIPRGVIN